MLLYKTDVDKLSQALLTPLARRRGYLAAGGGRAGL